MAKTKLENLIGSIREVIKPSKGHKPSKPELATIEMVNAISRESRRARQRKIINDNRNIEDWWTICGRRWLGDHHDRNPKKGMVQFTLNRDGNAIESNVAEQTLRPFRPRFSPVEVNDDPVYFVSNMAAQVLLELREMDIRAEQQGQQPVYPTLVNLMEEQLAGLVPLTPRQSKIIQDIAEPIVDPETGQVIPSPLDHRPVIAVNDAYRAKLIQRVFDRKWELGFADSYITENETLSNIFGSACLWCQVNPDNWGFEFVNPENMNVLADPKNTRVEKFNHLQIVEIVPLLKAIADMPKFKKSLNAAQFQGTIQATEEIPLGSTSSDTDYQLPQVVLKHSWIRGELYPMTVQEALRAKRVIPVENPPEGPEANGKFRLLETGEITDPTQDNWPEAAGIRYVKTLVGGDQVLEDVKSPYADIPVGWNKNRMIQHDPHGMGEPHRTFDLQNSINFTGEVLINRLLYSQYPIEMWPESLYRQFRGRGDSAPRLHPGRRIPVKDETWVMGARNGWQGFMVAPPDVPPQLISFWAELKSEYDRQSINTPARQGQQPSAGTSGKALETLIAQASGPVAIRARFTEEMVERVAGLLMQFLVDYMPEEEWAAYSSELTESAFAVIWSKFRTLEFDVKSEIVAGKGQTKILDEQRAAEDLDRGAISMETFRHKRGIEDSEGEDRKITDRQRKLNQAAMQPQAPVETQVQ